MPTKDNPIELGPGTVFFESGEGETLISADGIREASLEPDADFADTAPCIIAVDLAKEASFTGTMKMPPAVYYHFKRYEKWCKMLRKYLHLALHGKNRRIRKKNAKRFFTIYADGERAIKMHKP